MSTAARRDEFLVLGAAAASDKDGLDISQLISALVMGMVEGLTESLTV
jgi:hypothetical protein